MRKRNKWFELDVPSQHTHWCIHYDLPSDWEDRDYGEPHRAKLVIGFWRFFAAIRLWKVTPYKGSFEIDNTKRYGVTYFDRTIHFHWGKTYVKSLPWDWSIVRYDLLYPNGDLYHRNDYNRKNKSRGISWYDVLNKSPIDNDVEVAQYVTVTHSTRNGHIQTARIRLTGEEREWRWVWFKWLPWPRKIWRTVECESDIELGEKAGSWKGGLMGWGCEWKQGETMESAFWRWYTTWDGK